MNTFTYLVIFSLIGGLFSLIGGVLLILNKTSAERLKKLAPPFAAGALLSTAFLDLLTEGIHESDADTVLMGALIGVVGFYVLERLLHWFHHSPDYESHSHDDHRTKLIIIGDTVHNALDGVAIAASFLVSVPSGIVTSFVVALHEIPHEMSDFGLLLSRGMHRRKVVMVNILSALATTVVAIAVYLLGSAAGINIGLLSGLSAGFLLYIALSDIVPSLREKGQATKYNPIMLLAGAVLVAVVISLSHSLIDESDHGHEKNEEVHSHELIHEDEHSEHDKELMQ